MALQIPLGLKLREEDAFSNFVAVGNEQLVGSLQCDDDNMIFIWGGTSVGKSHLLHAWCKLQAEAGRSVAFLPLAQHAELSPEMCEGLEAMDAVALDDAQAIAGVPAWEEALFHLFNRLRDAEKRILIAGEATPSGLGLKLQDLVSRFNAMLIMHVTDLSDQAKINVLKQKASDRGLGLSEDVAQFLLRHYPRDMSKLMALLNQLDHASLAAQRRLTIPFVKQVMQA